MIRRFLFIYFFVNCWFCQGQTLSKLELRGDYSNGDSIQITEAYLNAKQAVGLMQKAMNRIWETDGLSESNKKISRKGKWKKNESVVQWLGQPEKIRLARRRISHIHAKFEKKIVLEVIKENKGRCKGWISAWTLPFGKVKIRLCDDYLRYRTHLHEKTLIHEMGHEIGMLLDRRIQGCISAQRAANSTTNVAKRSPENYAWLAMSYLGLECGR